MVVAHLPNKPNRNVNLHSIDYKSLIEIAKMALPEGKFKGEANNLLFPSTEFDIFFA